MKFLFTCFVSLCCGFLIAQNNARLFSSTGAVFRVTLNDKVINSSPQTEVLIENLQKDTIYLKITFENGSPHGITIYLLERGKKTNHREFDYEIIPDREKIKVRFSGIYDIVRL